MSKKRETYIQEITDILKNKEIRKWDILSILFDGNIPEELIVIIEKLESNKEFDRGKLKDVETSVDIYLLYTSFKEKYNFIPKIFPTLISTTEGLNAELVAEHFNVKSIRYALSIEEIHEEYQLNLALAIGSQIKDVVRKIHKYEKSLHGFVGGLPPVPFKDEKLKEWVVSHAGKTKNETIHQVAKYWEDPNFPRDKTLKMMKDYIEKVQIDKEWNMCKDKYSQYFEKPFECNIKQVTYVNELESAYILDPNDKLQTLLGTLTVCCQRLNSTGEASMMEGLINPNSGFLVFQREYKILGQAWVWLSADKSVLVLDNIELADNRKPTDIIHILYNWVEQQPYDNIQMGIGFNSIDIGEPVVEELKWYKQYWKLVYTDALNRVWLKKDGQMKITL